MEEYSSNEKLSFEKNVVRIALPVTLQSLLQSSFSVIDQVMIGQLGSSSIAGIGLGGKFASLYAVVLAAIASAAGIMISQYMGRKDEASAAKSFYVNLGFAVVLAAGFSLSNTRNSLFIIIKNITVAAGSRVYGALCTVSTKDYGSLHPR